MSKTSEADDLHVLAGLEQRLYEGLTGSDADILDDVMSDELVYIHSEGIAETKHENLVGQRSGFFKHGPVERVDGYTKVYGDLAVTVGALEMVDLGHGPAKMLHLQQILVWAREDGTWRLVLRQATRAGTTLLGESGEK